MNNDTPADAMQLKPCPFCGEHCAALVVDQGDKWAHYEPSCLEVRTGYDLGDNAPWRAELSAAWNTRTTSLSAQEPVAMRYDFDGYGWKYIDNGSGTYWRENAWLERHPDAEPVYAAPSLAAQDGLVELLDDCIAVFEGMQDPEIDGLVVRLKAALASIKGSAHE